MKINKTYLFSTLLVLASFGLLILSKAVFASFTVALLSGAIVAMGSLYAYSTMIRTRTQEVELDDTKDVIDMIEDPFDLYEDEREDEIADVKAMIKEEKARQKSEVIKTTIKNGSAWVSLYRLLPYAFLILGFLGLQNNHSLLLLPYLVGIGFGIIVGYLLARKWLIS